ncbi:MAG TPA: ATP-binding protein [Leptolyngbyaceae cyanobacterium]|nr:ATP-binding protein [Nostocaceae cyanobacterium]
MLFKFPPLKSVNHLINKVYAKMPLRTVLIVPFVLQICGAVGLVGIVSFANQQKAVENLANQLGSEISDRIGQHLDNYLATPKQINQVNVDAINLNLLNLSQFESSGKYFWRQMRIFNVGYISFANPQGEYIGIERLDNGTLLINEVTSKQGLGKLHIYSSDEQGNRRKLIQIKPGYDPHLEAWYDDAVKAGKPLWSQIYQWEDKPEVISIAASYPVHDQQHKFLGVISVDLLLSQINQYLTNLQVAKSGRTFILEKSGKIVANSGKSLPYKIVNGQAGRLLGEDSQDKLVSLTTQFLRQRYRSLGFIVGKQQLSFTHDGERYFVQIKNWRDDLGLDWLIVVVVPEADFMEEINANTRITIILCLLALLMAIQIGVVTSRWVIQPILQLNNTAKKIAQGEWEQITEINRDDELGQLAKSFNIMAQKLKELFNTLEFNNEELNVLNEALSESQHQVTRFLEAIPVGVMIIDAQGIPYYINNTGKHLLNQGLVKEVRAEKLSEIYQFYRAGTKEIYPSQELPIFRALQGEKIRVDDLELHQKEQIIPLEALGTPIYDDNGNILYAIATFSDITKRKEAEKLLAEYNRILESQVKRRTQELLQAIDKLKITQKQLIQSQKNAAQGRKAAEQASLAKSEFLANMSHELRTPLNAILGFTQLMSQDTSLGTEHQNSLAIINRAGAHLLNLINDILEMTKIEAGRTNLNLSSFDLHYMLTDVEAILHLRAVSKGLQIIFESAPDVPRFIQTDESKLRQVIINLLGNAIKFTETGMVRLGVSVDNIEQPEIDGKKLRLHFEVQDTGLGIAQEELKLLFAPFEQTETGKKTQQGTGLGLAISRKYVQLMGGEITVRSTPGIGSTFAFDIQVSQAIASDIPIKSELSQDKIIGLAPEQKEYRILVVDDSTDSRILLVKILEKLKFKVLEATNGQEAIAQWQSWHPHLILMDIQMPIMDGYQATREIKSKTITSGEPENTVIIALTASVFEEEWQKMLASGCDDLIRKPFTQELLLEKIREHLGVKYINQSKITNLPDANQATHTLTSESQLWQYLEKMPSDWLENMHNAAASCSDELILDLLQQVPPEQSIICQILQNLAHNYQFEKIMELTKTRG